MMKLVLLLLVGGAAYYVYSKRKAAPDKSTPTPIGNNNHNRLLTWLLQSYSGNLAIVFIAGAFMGFNYQAGDRLTYAFFMGIIFAFVGLLPLWFIREIVKAGQLSRAKNAAKRAGYSPRNWANPYIDGWWLRLILAQAPANYTLEFTDAALLNERAAMPRFRLLWNRNHHNREQSDAGWIWAETLDGNPSVGNPPPEAMRTFLQWPQKMGGKHRLTLWEITPETAASLNDGPLQLGTIPVKAYPSGEAKELTHWIGNIEGKVVKKPAPNRTDAHGTADPVGLRNMDPAPDPHGSAQAGGLGDMHLRS